MCVWAFLLLVVEFLRQSETFSIREVAYCYLEPNGAISVLKNHLNKKINKKT